MHHVHRGSTVPPRLSSALLSFRYTSHRMMAIRLTTDGWSANTSRVVAAIMGLSAIQRIER